MKNPIRFSLLAFMVVITLASIYMSLEVIRYRTSRDRDHRRLRDSDARIRDPHLFL